jgi:DnaJ-class molecular chaperone
MTTCRLCNGTGIISSVGLTGCTCPVCGGTGTTTSEKKRPAEKTLLDEFAMAAMAAIVSKTEMEITPFYSVKEKIQQTAGGAYSYAAAMMAERNRRDEMGNVKEDTEQ